MAKTTYLCDACGYVAPSYLGRCPECQGWNTFTEQQAIKLKTDTIRTRNLIKHPAASAPTPVKSHLDSHILRLSEVRMENAAVIGSGFAELDRVLGGGIMPGGYVLIGGDPGIGKSTLMLQMAARVGKNLMTSPDNSNSSLPVLYVAGEESAYQVRLRAERLGVDTRVIGVLPITNVQTVVETIQGSRPHLVIIDSIQSMYCPDVAGTPGSVSQIRECAAILMDAAKQLNVSIFLIGHVTKDGAVAGPKLLEHTVDAVLYFEGDKYQNLRVLRTVKNRFGSTQEIGVFEMVESGLQEIDNPSALFLSHYGAGQPGSVVAATLEGSRPLLVEIQALVGQSTYPSPRRVGNGIDHNRLHQIVAVLERRLGLDFSRQDIYVNVVGGLRVDEPAADLAVAIAVISSARDLPVIPGTAVTGEIGLTGEVRTVSQTARRIKEAERIGLTRLVVPQASGSTSKDAVSKEEKRTLRKAGSDSASDTIDTLPVTTMADAVKACFAPREWVDTTTGEITHNPIQPWQSIPSSAPF